MRGKRGQMENATHIFPYWVCVYMRVCVRVCVYLEGEIALSDGYGDGNGKLGG